MEIEQVRNNTSKAYDAQIQQGYSKSTLLYAEVMDFTYKNKESDNTIKICCSF